MACAAGRPHTCKAKEEARPNVVAGLQRKESVVDQPPVEHNLTAAADIEPGPDRGISIVTPLVKVNLTELLMERLTLNVLAARRRELLADDDAEDWMAARGDAS